MMNQYFGWLYNVLGVPFERLSLLCLADPVLLEAFAAFCRERQAPTRAKYVAQIASTLVIGTSRKFATHGIGGFLRQQARTYYPILTADDGMLADPAIRRLYCRDLSIRDCGQSPRELIEEILLQQTGAMNLDEVAEERGRRVRERDLFETWCEHAWGRLNRLASTPVSDAERPAGYPSPLERVNAVIDATPERRRRPITVIREILDGLKADIFKMPRGNQQRIERECDYLTVAFAAAVPVREETARHVRLHPDLLPRHAVEKLPANYEPSLIKCENGSYWYREHRQYFKTRKAMKKNTYEIPVPSWMTPILDYYIWHVRPQTHGGQAGSPYLHVRVRRGGSSTRDFCAPVKSGLLAVRMAKTTQRYVVGADLEGGESPLGEGLRYHWVRHLVATDLLRAYPGALNHVAHVLNDRLETVTAAYDGTVPADGYRFADECQAPIMRDEAPFDTEADVAPAA